MTLSELQRRDRRISWLEQKGRARSRDEDHELATLCRRRDVHWDRLPKRIARLRSDAAGLEFYARQIGFTFEERTTA